MLVNDGVRRQLIELDAKLARVRIVLDSVAVGGNGYGPTPSPLISYIGDSTLFIDGVAGAFLVIDSKGHVARAMAGPKRMDLAFMAAGPSFADDKGRLIFRAIAMMSSAPTAVQPTPGKAVTTTQQLPDSASLVRIDLDTRLVDTIARLKQQNGTKAISIQGTDGKRSFIYRVNPLETMDEWAVLSNGTLALVRGHDYHIDWLSSSGGMKSTEKLPFDWKKLSDADKQRVIDSTRHAIDSTRAEAEKYGDTEVARAMREVFAKSSAGLSLFLPPVPKPVGPAPAVPPKSSMPPMTIEVAPPSEIADYYPPVHGGSAIPDADGNVWILPNTSKQSKAGELVYDVVNAQDALTQRVRLPNGRSVAGFGKNGIVYLMSVDGANGWKLERAKLGN